MENQNQLPVRASQTTPTGSPAYSALAEWMPENPRPPSLTDDKLRALTAELTQAMHPATVQQYAQNMMKLIEFAGAFGLPCGDPKSAQAIYRETLADLPADLLALAITRLKSAWTWGNRMPFPAELRAMVADDLAARRSLLAKAQIAARKPPEEPKNNIISADRWEELRQRIRKLAPTNRTDAA